MSVTGHEPQRPMGIRSFGPIPAEVFERAIPKHVVEVFLRNWRDLDPSEWTLQGLGMLRCYIGDKSTRLHIWDNRFAVKDVSTLHDHPWDFSSYIVCGELENRRFSRHQHCEDSKEMHCRVSEGMAACSYYGTQQIICGPEGCAMGDVKMIRLGLGAMEFYQPGDVYHQKAEEIHQSFPGTGTVTLVHRRFKPDTEKANVFWPEGAVWVDARPRQATAEEVEAITSEALRRYF